MFDELHDPTPPHPNSQHLNAVTARARQIRFRRWATATTAIVAVLTVSFGAVIASDDNDNIKVENPPTVIPPTTTEPPTTPPDTTPRTPATTDAPDTTPPTTPPPPTAPETSPPTEPDDGVRQPEPAPLSVSFENPPPDAEVTPFAHAELELGEFDQPVVAVGENEVVIVHNERSEATARVVETVYGDQGDIPLDVPVSAAVVGPGPVLYGLTQDVDDPTTSSIVAIPLTGEQAGSVVATGDPLESTRYTELSPGRFGQGPDGIIDRQSGETLIGYVDVDGQPTSPDRDHPNYTIDESDTLTDGSSQWPLEINRHPEFPQPLFNQPPVPAPSRAGGVYWTWIGPAEDPNAEFPEPTMPVIIEVYDDGTGWWWQVPDSWDVVASDVGGTVLARRTDTGLELAWFDPLVAGKPPLPDQPTTPTSTTPPPATESIPLGALNADGDAVVIGTDGSTDVVWEAMEPPEEGEGSFPENVLLAGDAGPLLVAFCCEPASGTVYRIAPDTPDGRMPVADGVAPARSQVGQLATWHWSTSPPIIAVYQDGSGAATTMDIDGVSAGSADLMWVSEEQLVVLVEDPATNGTQLLSVHVPSQTVTGPVDIDGQASFAGIDADGSIMVLHTGTSTLSTYDPDTLEEFESDLDLPAPALSAWFADGHVAWVANDGTLTSDGTVIDGRYQWVRG